MDFGRTMRGGIIALVAGAVLVGCTPPTPEQARKQIERDIIEGEGAPVFRAARKHFPQDYEALLQELTAASQSSEGRNPLKATALGERITINWMEQLTDKLIPLVAEAPLDPLLARIEAGELDAVRAQLPGAIRRLVPLLRLLTAAQRAQLVRFLQALGTGGG